MWKAMAIALPIALLWGFSGAVQAANSHEAVITISQGALAGGCAWRAVIQRHSLRRTADRR